MLLAFNPADRPVNTFKAYHRTWIKKCYPHASELTHTKTLPIYFTVMWTVLPNSAKSGVPRAHFFVSGHPYNADRVLLRAMHRLYFSGSSALLLAVVLVCGASTGLNDLEDDNTNVTTPVQDKEDVLCIHTEIHTLQCLAAR